MLGRSLRFVVALGVLGIAVTGCKITGGGWIPGANGGKATFTVTWDTDKSGAGQLQYVDKSAGVAFHAVAGDPQCGFAPSAPAGGGTAVFLGNYRTSTGGSGGLFVFVTDNNGDHTPDSISLSICSGPYFGYSNSGPLGGNVRVLTS